MGNNTFKFQTIEPDGVGAANKQLFLPTKGMICFTRPGHCSSYYRTAAQSARCPNGLSRAGRWMNSPVVGLIDALILDTFGPGGRGKPCTGQHLMCYGESPVT